MFHFSTLILVSAFCVLHTLVQGIPTKPNFGSVYYAKGSIVLPYAEINEPFEAYVDKINNRSRIDYYNGMVKTFQRGDYKPFGATFEIVPTKFENQSSSTMSCFQTNGTGVAGNSVTFQDILPDLTPYNFALTTVCRGNVQCDVWVYTYTVGNRTSEYSFMIRSADKVPIEFYMKGYDDLFGSHFDEYVINYDQFVYSVVPSSFEVPNNATCTALPGSSTQDQIANNPFADVINRDQSHLNTMFKDFKTNYNKDYKSSQEEAQRLDIFNQNVRFVNSINRAGKSYKVKLNHLADRTPAEMKKLLGSKQSPGPNGGKAFNIADYNTSALPDSIDWRIAGAVTPVKDQAICGSCWSFGAAGTMEGTYFLKTGKRISLSEQNLVDCSWGFGNNGCDGGEDFQAYQYVLKHGIFSDEQYGPYLGADGICNPKNLTANIFITSYTNVTPGDILALKTALVNHGPISISIDASHRSLSFYDTGVYYEPQCGNKPEDLDHSVLLVGYGTFNNQGYWLVKNSWSTHWGNYGYVLMSQQNNNCGVLTAPTFTTM